MQKIKVNKNLKNKSKQERCTALAISKIALFINEQQYPVIKPQPAG